MALALTDEHAQLADSVRAWSKRTSPPSVARAAADGNDSGAVLYRDTICPGLAELRACSACTFLRPTAARAPG